jgi:sugar (pentulose or hexulose) kinase
MAAGRIGHDTMLHTGRRLPVRDRRGLAPVRRAVAQYLHRLAGQPACATITHIPAGRALNALVNLLSELAEAQGLSLADPWPYITRQAAEAGGTEMRVNLAFFDSSCGDRGEIAQIREAELTVGHLFRAAFQNMADNYYACALQLSPKQAWDNLVLSGGLAQIGLLCQLIAYKFGKGYRLCPTSEDTLLGLLALALAFTRRAASVGEAMSMLLEAHGGQDARQHPG